MSASRNHSPRIEQERAPKFVFECVTAHIYAASSTDADFIDFSWSESTKWNKSTATVT